ncbi:MAG: DUF3945 domain-containing protein [Rikenellaceae bacterium]
MKNKINDGDVLLVQEPQSETLKAVSGVDKDGKLKTVAPTAANSAEFLKIDKQSNPIENFFTNFMRQAKNPSHFRFFAVPSENVAMTSEFLGQQLKLKDDEASVAFVKNAEVHPSDYVKEQSKGYKPYDVERIDWDQFEKLGIKREALKKSGALEQMINYRKSPELMDINTQVGDINIRTQGRLSLRETEDGRIVPVIHALRNEPQLDRPFYGHTFTAEDKANLKNTGNLGRKVELLNRNTGEITPSYVSVDKLTNELVAVRADRIKMPKEIKGVELTPEQQATLAEGKELYLEGMTSKGGKKFDATVQFNADRRSIEFRFDPQQNQQQRTSQRNNSEFTIPTKLGGKELSPEDRQKLSDGGTIYVEGLKDRAGKEYNAYIKVNPEKGKLDFFRWNPDKAQSKNITPDNNSQTQVAVNSEGKNNEATKSVNEPLKQSQKRGKSKGIGM